jgi:hypothetical protein
MSLSREHVDAAVHEMQQDGIRAKRRSTGWCLDNGGIHFPPKYTVGRAHWFETGQEWLAQDHYGGEPANRILRRLGYSVIACPCRNNQLRDNPH